MDGMGVISFPTKDNFTGLWELGMRVSGTWTFSGGEGTGGVVFTEKWVDGAPGRCIRFLSVLIRRSCRTACIFFWWHVYRRGFTRNRRKIYHKKLSNFPTGFCTSLFHFSVLS